MNRFALKSALLAFTALSAPAALAGGFDQAVIFGDSSVDDGYFRYTTTGNATYDALVANAVANGGNGAFVGPYGVENTNQLAAMFGLSLKPSSNGGTSYANGGALTALPYATADNGLPYLNGVPANVPATQQISNYLTATHGVADSSGLYLIGTGGNDMILAASMVTGYYSAATGGAYGTWTMSQAQSYLSTQAGSLATSVASLQAAGARTIVVPNVYMYSETYGGPASVVPTWNAIGSYMNSAMWADLTAKGVNFIPADYNSLFTYITNNPTQFGFTAASVVGRLIPYPTPGMANNTEPCPVGSLGFICGAGSGAVFPISSAAAQQSYMFVDGVHLSNASQTIQADYVASLLTAPTQMALLPAIERLNGLAETASIFQSIDLDGRNRGANGLNVWANASDNSLKSKNVSGSPSGTDHPFVGTVGVDYRLANGVILGGALSISGDGEALGGGASAQQSGGGLNLYGAYRLGQAWGEALLGYGLLNDETYRPVTLGIMTDVNSGQADGHIATAALRGGYDFGFGSVKTGPVAGIIRQTVTINGFTESGSTGTTALSFGQQSLQSLVTPIGWRAETTIGDCTPFAEIDWNHEWMGRNHTISTAITTSAAAPYSMAAATESANWGTALLGASYRIAPAASVNVSANALFGNAQNSSYGGRIGLSVGF